MAQRTENEETEFKVVPESITLCANCNVAGNCAAANNLCQKCLASSTSTAAATTVTHMNDVFSFRSNISTRFSPERNLNSAETSGDLDKEAGVLVKREVNRCSGCRRKVGLTGFRCRCGELFCAQHRYSDRHDCNYDYKAAGRGAIARENPVVKAAKIVRI